MGPGGGAAGLVGAQLQGRWRMAPAGDRTGPSTESDGSRVRGDAGSAARAAAQAVEAWARLAAATSLQIEGRAGWDGGLGCRVGLIKGWISAALRAKTRCSWRLHPFVDTARARLLQIAAALWLGSTVVPVRTSTQWHAAAATAAASAAAAAAAAATATAAASAAATRLPLEA
jgi:hypothetical protein